VKKCKNAQNNKTQDKTSNTTKRKNATKNANNAKNKTRQDNLNISLKQIVAGETKCIAALIRIAECRL